MSRRNVRFHAMNRFTALVAALPLTVGVLLPAPARAADLTPLTTLVSSVISSASVLLGTTSVISGSVAGPAGRPVSLQVKVASGWRTLRSSTTTSTHTYRLAAPSSWLGGHTLRVVAPSTTDAPTAVSSSRLFSVRPTWSPAGTSSDWHWLSSSHARFNPCAPITWRFNQNGGYSGSLTDLKGAFRRLSQATGMTFTYKGTTTVTPKPGSYDSRVTLTVGFTTPSRVGSLGGSVAGQGGGGWANHDGYSEMVRGSLILDRTERLPAGFSSTGGATWGQIMQHEIGHTLGLGHASGTSQLMNGMSSSRNHRFGAGDLTALRNVGLQAGCIPHSARRV
jgi:hypothetical protein